MKNDYQIGDTKISIPPTILFSTIGKIEDVRKAVTMDAKRPGDMVYVLGETRKELGGSEWYALNGYVGNRVPQVDTAKAKKLYLALTEAMANGLVASCHDCSDGGLGVALAEVGFAGGLGLKIDLDKVPVEAGMRADEILFSESQSRFVVTVKPEEAAAFEAALAGNVYCKIGAVTADGVLVVEQNGQMLIQEGLADLKQAWQAPLDF
jgi:phosphoribosylformylglycinamidine synthase